MYETTFSSDWDRLDREEAVERAFALGVSAACGEDDPAEYERLKDSVTTAYDRSLIELAFAQGRSKGLHLVSSGENPEKVWSTLVTTTSEARPTARTLPDALRPLELFDLFGQIDGPPSSLTKPAFLLRNGDDSV